MQNTEFMIPTQALSGTQNVGNILAAHN